VLGVALLKLNPPSVPHPSLHMLYMVPGQLLLQLPLLHFLLRNTKPGCEGKRGKHAATDQLPHLCCWAARWAQVGVLLQQACEAGQR
jgi:hypothetical protein